MTSTMRLHFEWPLAVADYSSHSARWILRCIWNGSKLSFSFSIVFIWKKKFKEEHFQQNFYLFTDHQSYDKFSFV